LMVFGPTPIRLVSRTHFIAPQKEIFKAPPR
jgi:hypothetical protein